MLRGHYLRAFLTGIVISSALRGTMNITRQWTWPVALLIIILASVDLCIVDLVSFDSYFLGFTFILVSLIDCISSPEPLYAMLIGLPGLDDRLRAHDDDLSSAPISFLRLREKR